MTVQIPYNKNYFTYYYFFKIEIKFVPKIFKKINEKGIIWEEINPKAKFKISIK